MMVVNDCIEFGQMLKERRRELNYTQSYIADYTGLSVSFISNLENGKETAELGKAMYYLSILGMDIDLSSRG